VAAESRRDIGDASDWRFSWYQAREKLKKRYPVVKTQLD
jgi:hypothetical protein